jgi:hypothetical protein
MDVRDSSHRVPLCHHWCSGAGSAGERGGAIPSVFPGFQNGNIIGFIEQTIPNSDFFVTFFTPSYLVSANCKKGWDMAVFRSMRIIPMFEGFKNVPLSCPVSGGINMSGMRPAEIAASIYQMMNL